MDHIFFCYLFFVHTIHKRLDLEPADSISATHGNPLEALTWPEAFTSFYPGDYWCSWGSGRPWPSPSPAVLTEEMGGRVCPLSPFPAQMRADSVCCSHLSENGPQERGL